MDILLVRNVANVIFLIYFSYEDIRSRSIRVWEIFAYMVTGFGVNCYTNGLCNSICIMLPGIYIFLLGIVTKEKIGFADAFCIMGLQLWDGYYFSLIAIGIAFGAVAIYAFIRFLFNRNKSVNLIFESSIPFIPFLLFGVICYEFIKI